MYEIYSKIRDAKGYKDSDVSKGANVTKSTFSDWKSGRSMPKGDKLVRIASFLDVSVEQLLGSSDIAYDAEGKTWDYYMDDSAKDMAQFLFENPEYKVLFDASRKVKKEDLEKVAQMIKLMSEHD